MKLREVSGGTLAPWREVSSSIRRMRTSVFRFAVVVVALFLVACSSYDAKWREACAGRHAFAGAYAGRWQSGGMSTGGSLRCILTQKDAGVYEAWFHARWHGIFQSKHRVVLATRAVRKGLAFEGAATLQSWLGAGAYRCSGLLTPGLAGSLRARYEAAYDTGTFTLERAKPL